MLTWFFNCPENYKETTNPQNIVNTYCTFKGIQVAAVLGTWHMIGNPSPKFTKPILQEVAAGICLMNYYNSSASYDQQQRTAWKLLKSENQYVLNQYFLLGSILGLRGFFETGNGYTGNILFGDTMGLGFGLFKLGLFKLIDQKKQK